MVFIQDLYYRYTKLFDWHLNIVEIKVRRDSLQENAFSLID